MIEIGFLRNLALIGISFVNESDEKLIIYDVFDMDLTDSFCIVECVDDIEPTEFMQTVALMNGKQVTKEFNDYDDYLPMQFTVATAEHHITEPNNLIVIGNPSDIDFEKVDKCMDYLRVLKSR